jgi:hypothetical protein
MTTSIIISISLLIILAYIFDLTANRSKIPTVILLLVLGFSMRYVAGGLNLRIPYLSSVLPLLGTIGLILIVLEGSLELEINREKMPILFKSALIAFLPLMMLSFGMSFYLVKYENVSLKIALANVIPLAIISSAIAIPSAKNLPHSLKEFITYETSLSDIFGVIFFNFITLNDNIGTSTFGTFILQLILMLILTFVATISLAIFLYKIQHHIKFVPILVMVFFLYGLSKAFHLPALIFILLFGLFLGNVNELKRYKFMQHYHLDTFNADVFKFREITTEIAFLIRSMFFILFGFLIELDEVLNSETILLAAIITGSIFLLRFLFLKIFSVQLDPLVFMAPRGLITILLFLSIPLSQQIPVIDKSLITQVILLTALIMMIGLIRYPAKKVA